MPPATALLLHGFTSGPASMWRFQEWLAELGYQAQARAQLGHGGRGPAADYSLAALAADNLAMGDHDLVVSPGDLGPAAAGNQPRQRGEPHPISRLVPDPPGVPPQHRVLMPEHQQLSILSQVLAEQ